MDLEKSCQEAEADIKIIREKLHQQAQQLQNVTVDKYIRVERRKDYGDKRIYVYVSIRTKTTLNKITRTEYDYKTSKQFTGLEKKQALQYAKELQKLHGLRIVKENWK